jgi:hypothetical protein
VFIENPLVRPSKIDSDYKFKEIISKQHLFQTEKVSQYQFGNEKLKETILGTRAVLNNLFMRFWPSAYNLFGV